MPVRMPLRRGSTSSVAFMLLNAGAAAAETANTAPLQDMCTPLHYAANFDECEVVEDKVMFRVGGVGEIWAGHVEEFLCHVIKCVSDPRFTGVSLVFHWCFLIQVASYDVAECSLSGPGGGTT